jgi:hypothetical protein
MIGTCKLCQKYKELRNSHAIPDSIFRTIFKKDLGKAILLTTDDHDVVYSSDSLDTQQLCDDCEKKLNHEYEVYSINLLRNAYKNVKRTREGVCFSNVDVEKLMKFILAIYWRAAVSEHESYSGAVMNAKLFHKDGANKLRNCLLNNLDIPKSLFSVQVRRLCDSTGSWDLNILKELIVTPFSRPYGKEMKTSVNFVIEGFYISVVMPSLSNKERRQDLVLYPRGNQFVAKFIDYSSIPELVEIAHKTHLKVQQGKSRVCS